jgi:2,3-bisphosphoglycerate-independent phosphoglycerate mutase
LTVTTLSCVYAGVPLLRASDLAKGRGISADITGEGWHALGYPEMPTVSPAGAGRRLAALVAHYDFVLFEYWRTDHAGHARDMKEAVEVLETFDAFLGGLLDAIDPSSTLLLITSDHGNIEDITVKTHTRHPVPIIVYGRDHRDIVERVMGESHGRPDLTMVAPAIMSLLSVPLVRAEVLTA